MKGGYIMKVTVEGLILESHFEEKLDKNGEKKEAFKSLLYQTGEKENVVIKSPSRMAEGFATITGRLMSWKSRDGVGLMILAD